MNFIIDSLGRVIITALNKSWSIKKVDLSAERRRRNNSGAEGEDRTLRCESQSALSCSAVDESNWLLLLVALDAEVIHVVGDIHGAVCAYG